MSLAKINHEQRLYVIPSGKGYSCLGFDYAESQRVAVLKWMREPVTAMEIGTEEHFAAYREAMARGERHAKATGTRCSHNLTPQLRGFEGSRVEVTSREGDKRRFWVGKSGGWMPCHLETARRDSAGGVATWVQEGDIVRTVRATR